jgi:hypothetical protein
MILPSDGASSAVGATHLWSPADVSSPSTRSGPGTDSLGSACKGKAWRAGEKGAVRPRSVPPEQQRDRGWYPRYDSPSEGRRSPPRPRGLLGSIDTARLPSGAARTTTSPAPASSSSRARAAACPTRSISSPCSAVSSDARVRWSHAVGAGAELTRWTSENGLMTATINALACPGRAAARVIGWRLAGIDQLLTAPQVDRLIADIEISAT